jgi:hypothetical protein
MVPFTVKPMQLESGRYVFEITTKGESTNAKGERVARQWSLILATCETETQAHSMVATLTLVLEKIYKAGCMAAPTG